MPPGLGAFVDGDALADGVHLERHIVAGRRVGMLGDERVLEGGDGWGLVADWTHHGWFSGAVVGDLVNALV